GNGNINTQRLWNHDLHLRLGIHTDKEKFEEYAQNNNSRRYRQGVEGELDWTRKSRKAWFAFYDGSRSPSQNDWFGWEYTRTTDTTTIEHRDPAKILIAGNLSLNGNQLHNQYSQILVGKALTLGEQRFRKNTKNETLTANNVQLINEDLIGEIHRRDDGQSFMKVAYKDKNPIRPRYGHRSENYQDYHHIHPIEYFNFKIVDNTIGQAIQPTGTAIRQQTIAQQAALNNLQVDFTQSTPLSAVPHVRAVLPNQLLPQASLYRLNLATNSHVLVETDPRFTNKRQWLSSDYMFDALRADPQTMLKRLGDGYYEQRLVNEQINQLTGQRFLGNYTSDYEQYKALMDAGIRYAQRYQLIPGIALNAIQMQELTEDIVWLAPQTVTLKDGSQLQVLVPQVYLVKRDVDIQPTGAIISAKEIDMAMDGIVKNSGLIAGRHLTQISAQNLENYGTITADQLNFNVTNRFYQQGGTLAANNLNLAANTILIESRFSENQYNGTFYRRQLDQQAQLNVKNDLTVTTQGDAQFNAVKINTDNATLYIGGNLTLGTQAEINKEHYVMDADNYWKLDQHNDIATTLTAKGNTTLLAQKDINLRGTQIDTKKDLILASQQGDIHVDAARKQEQLSSGIKHTDKGLLSRTTIITKHDHQYDLTEGSQLAGNNVHLLANQGKVAVEGSTIVADKNVTLQAQELDISAAKNTRKEDDFYAEKKSGLMSGGSLAFTIGSRKQATDTANQQTYYQGSQIGALQGDIYLAANDSYRQQGSRITAGEGDITILAKKVDITATEDKFIHDYQHTFKQSGLTFGINLPIVQAAQQIQQTAKSVAQVGDAKDNRINALAAINAAFDLANTADMVGNVASEIANQGVQGLTQNIGISVGYGKQKNEQTIHTETTTANRSKVNAAGKVNVLTTKDSSYIQVKGSDIAGQQGTSLLTQGNLDITAQQQTHSEQSQNKSSGWNAGVAVNYNSAGSVSLGITAGGNAGKGYSNGEETTWINSHIGDKQSQTTLISGEDLTIKGGQVVGDSVKVQANNLNITSLQDTATYQGKQKQTSAQMTVGYGASLSGNYNQSKINADYASVNQQSGILAGDEGFNVDINNHTDLKGGVITATTAAELQGKNQFATGTIQATDLQNYSEHQGSAFAIGGSVAMNFATPLADKGQAQSDKQATNKKGEPLFIDKSGKETTASHTAAGEANQVKLATGRDSFTSKTTVGLGKDKEQQSSTIIAGVGTANMIIRDPEAQLNKTGLSVNDTITKVQTTLTTDEVEKNSSKLTNHFDQEKVLKELNVQVKVTQDFRKNAFSTIDNYVLQKQAELRKQIKAAKTEEEKTVLYQQIYKLQYQKRLLETVVGIVAGSPDLAITQGTLQLAATKMREESLANSRKFKGIIDAKTGEVLRNDSYDSGYFDGVKLGGVRIDLNIICNSGMGTCTHNSDGSVTFKGEYGYSLFDAIDPSYNENAKDLYGETGGFQPIQGEWNLHLTRIPYAINSFSDMLVESYAGTHDLLGGQIWGWYNNQGNTAEKNSIQSKASQVTTITAIPVATPFAMADLISADIIELLSQLGEH
ncbi:hypothetical protein QV08_11580, partial [Gallibacterium salpingitidis]